MDFVLSELVSIHILKTLIILFVNLKKNCILYIYIYIYTCCCFFFSLFLTFSYCIWIVRNCVFLLCFCGEEMLRVSN